MTAIKYGHLMKEFVFQDYGNGDFRQGTKMNGSFFGFDICLEYGSYWSAGKWVQLPMMLKNMISIR